MFESETTDMDPKIFLASLAVMAILVVVLPWRRRQKRGNRLSHDDRAERNRAFYHYSDGRPDPTLDAIDDIAAEVSEPPTDVSTGSGD